MLFVRCGGDAGALDLGPEVAPLVLADIQRSSAPEQRAQVRILRCGEVAQKVAHAPSC
jgi:hypothetical protein